MTIYFISGHTNLTKEEFNKHYKPLLDNIINDNNTNSFVIGNSEGADKMAFQYLISKGISIDNITIYYFSKNNQEDNFYFHYKPKIIQGFTSYEKRDAAMTNASDKDILWIRPKEDNKKLLESLGEKYRENRISATERNLQRRKLI